jgi:hypothetical protein
MTQEACFKQCVKRKTSYAALAKGDTCYCTNTKLIVSSSETCDTPCKGNKYETCGSRNTANLFTLKVNNQMLRQTIKNLEEPNTYVHKSTDSTWVRYRNNVVDLIMTQVGQTSEAIILFDDCTRSPGPDCATKYVELNGIVDLILTVSPAPMPTVTQIKTVWDITFAFSKSKHADEDVLLFRRTACEWVLKVNNEIVEEFDFKHFDKLLGELHLVPKSGDNRHVKITSSHLREIVDGVPDTPIFGKWFNLINPIEYYFDGLFKCRTDRDN